MVTRLRQADGSQPEVTSAWAWIASRSASGSLIGESGADADPLLRLRGRMVDRSSLITAGLVGCG